MSEMDPAECSNCGSTDKVAWYSFGLDLPALQLCQMCAFLLTTNPLLFEQLGKRRKRRPARRAAGAGADHPGGDRGR